MIKSQVLIAVALVALGACSKRGDGETNLRDLRLNRGAPEEFAIVPPKPLETPPSYAELPQPTPGQANRTDATPLKDAVAALGGNPASLDASGVPASDTALLSSAARFGTQANIRGVLAEEDLAFRKRKSIFNWKLIKDDEYNKAYRGQALDPYLWLRQVRKPGSNVRTPSAPPQQ
ncbi:MAG: DUF3035 domain-containing protein [Pseudomonadota bacterium]|nr:DUF3035 domain-containing protein [Pseudomonadota bacterium]MEC8580114.1 DUF3035 domain-containing protein [Pseudomonadota bacterium]MEE3361328.1 DUF3035 domain-containing protein [Pseudomonadota bacterium]